MTDDNTTADQPDTKMPSFSVNVIPTHELRMKDITTLINGFRQGNTEPAILGENNKPEAAIIPFEAFVQLMRYNHAAHVREETAFQGEVSRRVQHSDTYHDSQELTVEELAESLGPTGQQWAAEQRAARAEHGDD